MPPSPLGPEPAPGSGNAALLALWPASERRDERDDDRERLLGANTALGANASPVTYCSLLNASCAITASALALAARAGRRLEGAWAAAELPLISAANAREANNTGRIHGGCRGILMWYFEWSQKIAVSTSLFCVTLPGRFPQDETARTPSHLEHLAPVRVTFPASKSHQTLHSPLKSCHLSVNARP